MKRLYNKILLQYFNVKNGVNNLYHYFKPVWNSVRFDYSSTLPIQLKSLQLTLTTLEHYQKHCIAELSCAIALLDNIIEDAYDERCGYIHPRKIYFDECRMIDDLTEAETENNQVAIQKAIHLREREVCELYDIMKHHADSWWI